MSPTCKLHRIAANQFKKPKKLALFPIANRGLCVKKIVMAANSSGGCSTRLAMSRSATCDVIKREIVSRLYFYLSNCLKTVYLPNILFHR